MPKFPEILVSRLPAGLDAALHLAAAAGGVTRAELVRTALADAVKNSGVTWPPRSNALARLLGIQPSEEELKERLAAARRELAATFEAMPQPDDEAPH